MQAGRRSTLHSTGSRRSSVVPAHPKRAAMPFSSKAREIHDHIVSSGKADYWIGVARSLVERKGQYQPGKPYARDVPALKEKLKAELSSAVKDANDNHWEEIAHWLVYEARSGREGNDSGATKRRGHLSAWMRSAGTSTSVTPRKENKSFTRYMGGCSEVCFTMWPTASVTAAWNITPSACRPARFTRTSWPGCNMTRRSSRCAPSNASRLRHCFRNRT